jgi:hypothetical protein
MRKNVLYEEQQIEGKRIYTYIICTQFPTPSKVTVPDETISLKTARQYILDVLALRFDPPLSVYRELEQYLLTISDETALKDLLTVAVQSENLVDFQNQQTTR